MAVWFNSYERYFFFAFLFPSYCTTIVGIIWVVGKQNIPPQKKIFLQKNQFSNVIKTLFGFNRSTMTIFKIFSSGLFHSNVAMKKSKKKKKKKLRSSHKTTDKIEIPNFISSSSIVCNCHSFGSTFNPKDLSFTFFFQLTPLKLVEKNK